MDGISIKDSTIEDCEQVLQRPNETTAVSRKLAPRTMITAEPTLLENSLCRGLEQSTIRESETLLGISAKRKLPVL